MIEPRTQLADTISALVDPYQHAESYTLTLRSAYPDGRTATEIRVHRTSHRSLINQLADAVQPAYDVAASGLHGGYQSKPTATALKRTCVHSSAQASRSSSSKTPHAG